MKASRRWWVNGRQKYLSPPKIIYHRIPTAAKVTVVQAILDAGCTSGSRADKAETIRFARAKSRVHEVIDDFRICLASYEEDVT